LSSDLFAPAAIRPRKVRSDSIENRERVLAAAREVFAESGLDALIPDIAARAGVGKGTVYRHFPSKEALIQAILDAYWRQLETMRQQALANDDPWAGFAGLLRGMISVKDEQRAASEILIASKGTRPKDPVYTRIDETLVVLFRRAQEAGIARMDVPAETMPLVLRSTHWAVKYGRDLRLDWQPYLQAVLDGLRAGRS